MSQLFEEFAGLAARVLAAPEAPGEGQRSTIRPNGDDVTEGAETTIALVLSDRDDETVASISVSRTRD
jgi:hypothetical protein